MPKKIETDSDVEEQEKEAEDVEIEYLTEQKKTPKKEKLTPETLNLKKRKAKSRRFVKS